MVKYISVGSAFREMLLNIIDIILTLSGGTQAVNP